MSYMNRPQCGALMISAAREQDGLTLSLRGELDLASAPGLEQQLRDAQTAAPRRVVVDLSRLDFIDAAGLHVLLDARARMLEAGRVLLLRRGPRAVQRVFELTDTGPLFRFED